MTLPFKLGKTPARPWQAPGNKFRFETYLDHRAFFRGAHAAALPSVPPVFGHQALIGARDWGLFGNDQYGDCVWAGAAHETMMLAKEAGDTVVFNDAAVLSDYSAVTGFKISDPSTDQGTDIQVAAAYRRKTGITDTSGRRHTIAAFLALEPGNLTHLYQATYLFGAVGIGMQLPQSALDQFDHGQPWNVVQGSPNGGGHYVPLLGRTAAGLAVVSWGDTQFMSEAFLMTYCDEAVAYVSQECLVSQKSPEGFDYAALLADLKELA